MKRTGIQPRRAVAAGACSLIALTLGACAFSSEPSGNVSEGPADRDAVRLVVDDNSFSPGTLRLPAGEEVTVEIRNHDTTAHDFAIEGLDLNTGVIEPGGVATATFSVPNAATGFECTLHPRMSGRIDPR